MEVIIETKEQLIELIMQLDHDSKIDRDRSTCLFRGLSNDQYTLKTSLERNCGTNPSVYLKKSIEKSLLSNFSKYAAIDDPVISNSIWRQMILGQHHGLPTRLMDWTNSILVALHFAVSEHDYSQLNNHDCIVWKISMPEFKNNLPEKYKNLVSVNSNVFNVDILNKNIESLDEYDKDMENYNSMLIMEPPSIDQRIVNQYSFFTITPSHITNVEGVIANTNGTVKYIIKSNLRWYIRDLLDQLNISERTIYPGLDGTARWLARHYYVKK